MLQSSRRIILTLVVLGIAAGSGRGSSAAFVFDTGVNASGTPLAGGSTDPHWSIVSGPGITAPAAAFVVTNQEGGVYAQSAASAWIWVNADGSGSTGVAYDFRLTFDLTGLDPSTATLSGSWGVDNNGSIDLNGKAAIGAGTLSLTGGTVNNFNVFYSFSITGGFVAGVNTLDFLAEDDGNPGALNATNLLLTASPSSVPEPSSLGLCCIAALTGLAVTRARRKRA